VVEINVVDPLLRKGYRFKGIARVLGDGALFDEILAFFRKRGVSSPIKHVVVIQVERALPLVSPAYDSGATEEEVRGRWQDYWRSIERGDSTPTGERCLRGRSLTSRLVDVATGTPWWQTLGHAAQRGCIRRHTLLRRCRLPWRNERA